MKVFSKIRLSWRFGKIVYLISAILSLSMAVVVALSPNLIPSCILIKVVSIPIIHYLNVSMTNGMGIYFYLNLGISRKEYYSIPFIMDFLLFVLLMILAGVINYAIG